MQGEEPGQDDRVGENLEQEGKQESCAGIGVVSHRDILWIKGSMSRLQEFGGLDVYVYWGGGMCVCVCVCVCVQMRERGKRENNYPFKKRHLHRTMHPL